VRSPPARARPTAPTRNDDLGLIGGLLASAAWSLVIYKLAIARRLPEEDVDRYVADIYPPPVE